LIEPPALLSTTNTDHGVPLLILNGWVRTFITGAIFEFEGADDVFVVNGRYRSPVPVVVTDLDIRLTSIAVLFCSLVEPNGFQEIPLDMFGSSQLTPESNQVPPLVIRYA